MGEFLEAMQAMKGAGGGSKGPPPIPQAPADPIAGAITQGAAPVQQQPQQNMMQPGALQNIMAMFKGQPQQGDALAAMGGAQGSPISRILQLFHGGGQ